MKTDAATDTIRLLFVDDEENVLNALNRLFIDEGFDILTATSGAEGLKLLEKYPVAVIVSDQKMPGMIGAEFLAKSRDIRPDAVRMILTGYADINAAMDAINRGGAYRYITKPWNDQELVFAVKEAAERHHLVVENKRLTELTAQQNEELKNWSTELEMYVQRQTIDLTNRNKELQQLNSKLRKNFRDMIGAFLTIIELRDRLLFRHVKDVAAISSAMARELHMDDDAVEMVETAALLHDLGALQDDATARLTNKDHSTPEAVREYQLHPIRGQAIVTALEDLKEVGLAIRHHHEHYNGGGFPDKLSGTAIPLGARIIAAADTYDWMMHEVRADAVSPERVLEEIKGMFGTQLDPALFEPLSAAVRVSSAQRESEEVDVEVELPCEKLQPGMFVTRDIRSGTGLLLLSKGAALTTKAIDALKRYHVVDPLKEGVFVKMKAKRQK